jgi:acid phosphatase (class A)
MVNGSVIKKFRVVMLVLALFLVGTLITSKSYAQDNAANDDPTVGYLADKQKIDSIKLLNAAPADNSDAKQLDLWVANKMQTLEGTDRWIQAAADGNDIPTNGKRDSEEPGACRQFACQIGININQTNTPTLVRLLEKVSVDVNNAGNTAKSKYNQIRPFVKTGNSETCRPQEDKFLSTNGSYPSGHTNEGWIWGLTLTKADPEDANKIMQRARQYGESRLVCNVHWLTDIQGGRDLAGAVFADLEQSTAFQDDVKKATEEIKEAKKKSETVKKNWVTTLEVIRKFVEDNPDNEQAKKTLSELEPLKNWTCEKEFEALKSVNINEYIGR